MEKVFSLGIASCVSFGEPDPSPVTGAPFCTPREELVGRCSQSWTQTPLATVTGPGDTWPMLTHLERIRGLAVEEPAGESVSYLLHPGVIELWSQRGPWYEPERQTTAVAGRNEGQGGAKSR